MKPDLECAPCLLKWVYERSEVLVNGEKRFQIIRRITGILSRKFNSEANVGLISNKVTDSIDEFISNSAEFYEGLKLKSNQLADELLPAARNFIEKGQTGQEKFERACCLASASNVAPLGVPSEAFKFEEVINIMVRKNPLPIVIGDVFQAAQNATRVLYIADNAGEIGFDSLLISKLKEMGLKVTLVVKQGPFFDDATMKDASFFHLDKLADHIATVNGFFVPSESPSSLVKAFQKSDLVIAKGTGNYEALKGEVEGKTTLYMLKVKCKPIASHIGTNIGSFVVKLEK